MFEKVFGVPRRKFSFDLALHRSATKKENAELVELAAAVRRDEAEKKLDAAVKKAKVPPRAPARRALSRPPKPPPTPRNRASSVSPPPAPATSKAPARARESWLALREARQRSKSTTAVPLAPGEKPRSFFRSASRSPDDDGRGRSSARGDDSPRIREVSLGRRRFRDTQHTEEEPPKREEPPPPPPRRSTSKPPPVPRPAADRQQEVKTPRRRKPAGDAPTTPPPKDTVTLQRPQSAPQPRRKSRTTPPAVKAPSTPTQQPRDWSHDWQALKLKALAADSASIATFIAETQTNVTFEHWFETRFPENSLSSAPAAHRALWEEHRRQLRFRAAGGQKQRILDDPAAFQKSVSKSLTITSPRRSTSDRRTRRHVITWRVERWSTLPAGFRQGARYRPQGETTWSLDLYKGGIKQDQPGMVALYVHFDAPNGASFARVETMELCVLNQRGGAHLARRHEGARVFGQRADAARAVTLGSRHTSNMLPGQVSTSAGTATLAPLVLLQVEDMGFIVGDVVLLRADIEVTPLDPEEIVIKAPESS